MSKQLTTGIFTTGKTTRALLGCLALLCLPGTAMAESSTIAEVDGSSCLGDDKTRKQTERAAIVDARRNALEYAGAYITNTTQVANFQLQKDIIEAYTAGEVKILEILERLWQPPERDCFLVTLRAEVVASADKAPSPTQKQELLANPGAPLEVKLWTNQSSFRDGEQMQIFVQGNKDFYGRLVYTDAQQNRLQILPNPLRKETLFRGTNTYQVPSDADAFALTVQAPYGQEQLTLFASTQPLGNLDSTPTGPVYSLADSGKQIAAKTRGLRIDVVPGKSPVSSSGAPVPVAEFSEQKVTITTAP